MEDDSNTSVDAISISSYDWEHTVLPSNTMASGVTAGPYYSNLSLSTGTYNTVSPNVSFSPSATIQLTGEDADIKVNDLSLMQTLADIKERLNMLTPNAKLEAEWDQLRELGKQYRQLEADLLEKSRVWNILKKVD
jgi:hypothetical protein